MSFLLVMIHISVISQELPELSFEDWDKDSNVRITRSEFIEVFITHYAHDIDSVDNIYPDDEDFLATSYGFWDIDGDELLSEQEWREAGAFYTDDITNNFVSMDIDEDGFIEYSEFYDVLDNIGYFHLWDQNNDGNLNRYELARMLFNKWDKNISNFIELTEYKKFDLKHIDF